jgi:hypothetical protein
MEACTDHVYFVASAASGDGLGQTIANPCTLSYPLAMATDLLGSEPGSIRIYLTESVPLDAASTSVSVSYDCAIISAGSTAYSINVVNTPTSSVFTVTTNGSLSLMNVAVDGLSYGTTTNTTTSPFMVSMGGNLYLGPGAIIRNFHLVDPASGNPGGSGGAVYVMGGNLSMYGASIVGCSAASGGAVYLGYGSMYSSKMTMSLASAVSGCSADNGGAVYVSEGGLYLDGSGTLPAISGNTASTDGGGVYLGSMGYLYDPFLCKDSVIVGNTCSAGSANLGGTVANVDTAIHSMIVTATGTGTGKTLADPASFATALATSTVNSIILAGDVPLPAGITVSRQLNIWSNNGLSYSMYPSTTISGALITVATNCSLNLNNVLVGPRTGDTGTASTLIRVEYSGQLNLNEGAVLRNNTSIGSGAAVVVAGGSFQMNSGSIQNCSSSSSVGGGGVYVTTGSDGTNTYPGIFSLNGGTIAGCAATSGSGGGVYQSAGSVYLNGGTITGCSGVTGGGMYIASGAALYLQSQTYAITANTAVTAGGGGGVYVAAGGTYSDSQSSATACITGNTAGGLVDASPVTVQ